MIKGIYVDDTDTGREVQQILQQDVAVQITQNELYKVERTHEKKIIALKLISFEDKQKIMKNKLNLRRKEVNIENYLTAFKREI